VLRFCQQVDRGLVPALRGGSAPLVLAAVESVAAIYRQANTYRHLADAFVPGNPEGVSASDLHGRAWPLVESVMQGARASAIARFHAARGTGKATGDLVEALLAAADGRLDVLFVPIGVQQWGSFDEGARRAELHESAQPDDEDLLNVLAVRTLLAGGTVYAVLPDEVPGGAALAALLRY
jgi:hypothetical protein